MSIKRALLSVSDKTGIVEFARKLHEAGVEIISTGGTMKAIDDAQMQKFNIQPIDLVVVNLYPFRETIEKPNVTLAEAVENIDIGGPAMIRAAAKNFKFVTVVVNPKHYDEVAEMIAKDGCTTGKFRMQLAQEAFCHTSHYDDCIQEYLTAQLSK